MSNEAVAKDARLPHVEWVDIDDNGVAVEIIVMKRDRFNDDLYYIKTLDLDEIDRNRITSILKKRDADKYELWDFLDNTFLPNGENALTFFHQLVKIRTSSGQHLVPSLGRTGIRMQPTEQTTEQKRGPGRPPKN